MELCQLGKERLLVDGKSLVFEIPAKNVEMT